MKKLILISFAMVLLFAAITQIDWSIIRVHAQSCLWENFCAGDVVTVPQGDGFMVSCMANDPTPTPVTPTAFPTTPVPPTATPLPPSGNGILVDHNSVALFERIPEQYLAGARNLKVLFSDRSVGDNFHQGLNCLTASSYGAAPSFCRKDYDGSTIRVFNQADKDAGRVPANINFATSPTLYNRNNWVFEARMGTWSELTCNFVQQLGPAHMDKNVLSYQFSYLNVQSGSDIMRFWDNNPNLCDIYDIEAFMAQHPDKTFIFWTTSLARGIGTQEAANFNNRMRQYTRDQGRILFDFAAIESHTSNGQPCYDNRDGVLYTNPTNGTFENYPSDGVQLEAICKDYTTETDGGHLGSVSGGMIRTAKAFWVLMAQIAGWRP
jgi:hypothetical protein